MMSGVRRYYQKGDKLTVAPQKVPYGTETISVADVEVFLDGDLVGKGEIVMDHKGNHYIPPLTNMSGEFLPQGFYDLVITSEWRVQVRAKQKQ